MESEKRSIFRDETTNLGTFDTYLLYLSQQLRDMKRNNDMLTSGAATILNSLTVPLFALVFTALYRPYGIQDILDMPHHSFTFNLTILFCIVLVSISMTRVWLYLIGRFRHVSRPVYAVWCIGETVVASLFISLYMALMKREPTPFFDIVGGSLAMMSSISIYPYGIIWMGIELYSKTREEVPVQEDNSLIRFHDEYKKLRLVIAPEAVIFIKSEENYVQIHYEDQGKTKKFVLRSSMRALEDILTRHGLVRCHRSYFINPAYIRIVHRDTTGLIVAELKIENFESIPISRKYHEAITRLL